MINYWGINFLVMKISEYISKSYVFALAHSYDAIWRKFNSSFRKSGCNITEALVLISIFFEEDQRASPSSVAKALRTSRGNVSHCLTKLESRKLVKREMKLGDARRLVISLTPSGERLVSKLMTEIEKIEDLCDGQLGKFGQSNLINALFGLNSNTVENSNGQ